MTGHSSEIESLAVGEVDGTVIAVSASSDETLRAWNLEARRPLGEPFTGHTGFVNAVAIGRIHGSPVAVFGSHDNTVRIWSLAGPGPAG